MIKDKKIKQQKITSEKKMVTENKKSAFSADSLEFQDDLINSTLTSKTIIADQNILSRVSLL